MQDANYIEKQREASVAISTCMRGTDEAKRWHKTMMDRMAALEGGEVEALMADTSVEVKKLRRDIEKKMNIHVQQISSTLDQVDTKCKEICECIQSQPNPAWCTFCMLQFVKKTLKQYNLIVSNNIQAFSYAAVIVKVSTYFPELMDLTIGLLHRELLVTIPISFVHDTAMTDVEYHRLMQYVLFENNEGVKTFEGKEEMSKRVEGLMLLYGAIVQVEDSKDFVNPHGLDHGWRWLSRTINAMPADWMTAKALMCFLRHAGYSLFMRYNIQFEKLLTSIKSDILPDLRVVLSTDQGILITQLEMYLNQVDKKHYMQPPEGRNMIKTDESTTTKA